MSNTTTGRVLLIGPTQQVSEKFSKREIVLTTEAASQYPQTVAFQLSQDKCGLADRLKVGQDVTVQFNLRGRAWTNPQGETKYFNTLDIWRIEEGAATTAKTVPVSDAIASAQGGDDLPF